MAVDRDTSKKMVALLTTQIEALYAKSSMAVDSDLDADLAATLAAESSMVESVLPDGSFRKLFRQQQVKELPCKDPASANGTRLC